VGVSAKKYSGSGIKLEESTKRKNQKSKPPSLLLAEDFVDEFAIIRKREVPCDLMLGVLMTEHLS